MKVYDLSTVCELYCGKADPGMPPWANVGRRNVAATSNSHELAGGGIYACFWREVLIYIGSFVGPKEDPFGGHVADRISKHVLGFTLRAKELGFEKGPLLSIIDKLGGPIAQDLNAARRLSDRLERGTIKATFNKARFAKLHWDDLRTATPEDLLNQFSFAYRRLDPLQVPTPDKRTVKQLWITPIEKRLIQIFQPICNTEFRSADDGPPVKIDRIAKTFEREFSKPLSFSAASDVLTSQYVVAFGQREPSEDREVEMVIPTDTRWSEYYTDKGQMRVRAVSISDERSKGRTLLCRTSAKRVYCLADRDRLNAVGVNAKDSKDSTLPSAVAVDFEADTAECLDLLRKILEASLDRLYDLS